MATLTSGELTDIRHQMQTATVPWTKAQINAAAQAVEDILVGTALQTAINNAINSATSPVTLSATDKRRLVAYVIEAKYARDK